MRICRGVMIAALAIFPGVSDAIAQEAKVPMLRLNDQEYFEMPGINVMAFQDIYPEGHQAGVSIIQNGVRVATNGDIRLDPTPGQWQPMPKQDKRVVNKEGNEITTWLSYPDSSRNRTGFNPIDYPDLNLSYQVHVRAEGRSFRIIVDLDRPLPAEFVGKVGFNLELFPGTLFGKSWYLGEQSEIFPRQANGPDHVANGVDIEPVPLATGRRLSVAPEVEARRMIIESRTGDLQLLDGRNKHNNGWFVVRSLVPAGAASRAIDWVVTPHAISGWKYQPVVHVSQVGYHPKQEKTAVIELDDADAGQDTVVVKRITEDGGFEEALSGKAAEWGKFLRYKYLQFDFTQITKPGMYVVEYRNFQTQPFQISTDVYKRGVWQPVIEHFLPVQMCHMRVEEQYRVWHGACHLDDARMAPTNYNHFDGYLQGPSTLTKYKPGETVPELNVGGWHDAGDDCTTRLPMDGRARARQQERRLFRMADTRWKADFRPSRDWQGGRVAGGIFSNRLQVDEYAHPLAGSVRTALRGMERRHCAEANRGVAGDHPRQSMRGAGCHESVLHECLATDSRSRLVRTRR